MNKLFTKIATFAIGAFMAVGVGVAATLSGPEPIEAHATGTGGASYSLYTGALTEGEYIVVYNSGAMKASVTSSRLDYLDVTITDDEIKDPDASIIWTIAPSGSYWTIYNASVSKYAAGTGAKNKAQLLASGTDDKSLWSVSGTGTYEFVNKANKAASVNANLRRNGTYGFATYATNTGGALSLYKKTSDSGSEPETPTTPTLTGISLSGQQTEFTVGDIFVFDGTITANYDDGSTAEVAYEDAIFSGYDMSTAGTQTVTVTYTYEELSVTAEYEITVKEPLPEGYFDHTINIASYASSKGWKDSTQYDTIQSEPFTITATGGSNTGKYYTNGNNWRFYQSDDGTLSFNTSVGYLISTIKITYTSSENGVLTLGGANVASEQVVDINDTSVTFGVGNTGSSTKGQARVTEIYIIYTEVPVEIVPFTSISISDENLELNIGAEHTLTWEAVGGSNDTVLWESSAEGVATVSSGVVTAVDVGETTITAKSKADPNIFDTLTVNVVPASPTKIEIGNQNREFVIGKTIGYHFTSEQNVIKVTYSDNRDPVYPSISDERLTLTVGEQEVTSETIVTSELLEGKTIGVKFTDENGKSITHGSGPTNSQTIEGVAITGETCNCVGGVDYLLVDDEDSDLIIEYTSHFGALDLVNEVIVESTNEEVLAVDDPNSGIFDGTSGSFTLDLLAFAEGQASIYIYVLKEGVEIDYHSNPILVRSSAPSSGSADKYVKVTNTADITSGNYLIVYETGKLAFNGGLTTLDAAGNTVSVSISGNEIEANTATTAAQFRIDAAAGTVQSASGYYIGSTGYENKIISATDQTYGNTFSIDEDGNAIISSNLSGTQTTLKYNNTSGQERFRYYKSGQQAIQLYKFVAGSSSLTTDFDYANEFVETYMHTEIKIDVEGTGRCISEGWYAAAKAAFFDGTDGEFHLNRDQRNIVATSFKDCFVRLQNWAVANGETIELVGDDYQVSSLRNPLLRVSNTDSNATIIIISISSILVIATFIVVKKRRSLSK